ncbi:ATP-dependent sacrificial sulfur transferase LarE [Streptacidiphilus pinicola]|uniref:ATP-dependent sacrificial sulfur transferase LarE n=1 Tax=Streptacidiphilus pinicola TaxID=2219663 RepID=A0A2X0JGB5_9ACTN|nr:ATP-dependent sacrificial sulfur transferase LarE [Streptacidiphilus pinicola]RAG86678.1 ATP-dependent sacrificial sulfur transferase LarE [Streptacidiphilus pinicola]
MNSPTEGEHAVEAKAAALLSTVREIGPFAVAYSGGTDSALVLAAGVRALGAGRVLAVTAVSESLAAGELAAAHALADALGVAHLTPRTDELSRPGYRANGPDRCYFCKSEVLDVITALAHAHGFAQVATGTNADDAADPFRPGIRAGQERGIRTPLRDCGLTKTDVRAVSRLWSLPTWDKPATPCLASRIRYGIPVTGHRLARVDRAEAAVRASLDSAGLRSGQLRVRDLGDTVRIELDIEIVQAAARLPSLVDAVARAGFGAAPVVVDGFASGRLNHEQR